MVGAPEQSVVRDALLEESDEEVTPRFAERRLAAARRGGLPQRLLLNRARSEGVAHRRSESAELDGLDD